MRREETGVVQEKGGVSYGATEEPVANREWWPAIIHQGEGVREEG